MSIGEKLAGGFVLAMVATAVLLPGRQTVPAVRALGSAFNQSEKGAEGIS
jgi:hypothetical protein